MKWKTLFFTLVFFIFLGGVMTHIKYGLVDMPLINGYNVSVALYSLYMTKTYE